MSLFETRFAFLDVETTGTHATCDRVTEIGVVFVERGKVLEEWETLVNPERSIPPFISALTGITNETVALAPRFADIAATLWEKLEGCTLVAHNARFDAGFLKHEFRRTQRRYAPRIVCTVKLSRKLHPQHARHNLDALLERHGLACSARHRALGDARVLWQLLELWCAEHGADAVAAAARGQFDTPNLPPHLSEFILDEVPELPGVYLFYGENDLPLYVGKSVNLRARVLSHFSADSRVAKDRRIVQQVKRIDWKETAGELGALIEEARLVKTLAPLLNRHLRPKPAECTLRWDLAAGGAPQIVALEDAGDITGCYGLFRDRRYAREALRGLADGHGLCLIRLGLEQGRGACFNHQLKRCRGACTGREPALQHDLRLAEAFASMMLPHWPYRGAIGVREQAGALTQVHVVDRWCHLGTVASDDELAALAIERPATRFDPDTYRILKRFLDAPPHNARIFEIAA